MSDTITISRAEYERLVALEEDAHDNAAVANYLSSPEEGMPIELVRRMIAGESALAIHREWRGLSQAALAKQSGVNRVQIVNIESGKNSGSLETVHKLATALDVKVDDLI